MTVSDSLRIRRPLARLATGAAVALLASALPTAAWASGVQPNSPGYCSSAQNPQLAAQLSSDISGALASRTDTYAFTVADDTTGITCAFQADQHFDSASVVKVIIMGAVLRRAEDQHRYLTDFEDSNMTQMITASDNDAATALWNDLGMAQLQSFLDLAGMHDTQLGQNGYWGLTQITAADEMKALDVFVNQTVITPSAKAYALGQMSQVEADQRWGTPFGAPADVTVQVKNGWLPRATHGWRVHSLGIFTGTGKSYRMAVLTQDNAEESDGIDTIQAVAAVVHRDLNGGAASTAAKRRAGVAPQAHPGGAAPEAPGASAAPKGTGVSDGSAPFGPVASGDSKG
ncbi:serine hydrolase [Kitasatospora sp. LaBMicrA B282]|uniref:serine hydrolase n=1 Tax=Kitasatospora sp. LaBMicrA B282 TaxID=3420949 RepID=UPI003D0E9557